MNVTFIAGRAFTAHQKSNCVVNSIAAQASDTQSGFATRRMRNTVNTSRRSRVMESPSIIESIVATIGKLLIVHPGFGYSGSSTPSNSRPIISL